MLITDVQKRRGFPVAVPFAPQKALRAREIALAVFWRDLRLFAGEHADMDMQF